MWPVGSEPSPLQLALGLGRWCITVKADKSEVGAGLMVGIYHGDTITVLDAHRQQHKIRLAGIAALVVPQG
jgi:endonuclease YncB( thermonuclease family)